MYFIDMNIFFYYRFYYKVVIGVVVEVLSTFVYWNMRHIVSQWKM